MGRTLPYPVSHTLCQDWDSLNLRWRGVCLCVMEWWLSQLPPDAGSCLSQMTEFLCVPGGVEGREEDTWAFSVGSIHGQWEKDHLTCLLWPSYHIHQPTTMNRSGSHTLHLVKKLGILGSAWPPSSQQGSGLKVSVALVVEMIQSKQSV
jgi:hypothetical protein